MLQVVVGLCFCGETHETGENHEDVATATQAATCFISYATTWPVRGLWSGPVGPGLWHGQPPNGHGEAKLLEWEGEERSVWP
jgi:hypothetical protein